MLQKKIRRSLTVRIFLITALLLLGAGAITFGLIAWAAPSTYTAVLNDDLAGQVNALAKNWRIPPWRTAARSWMLFSGTVALT